MFGIKRINPNPTEQTVKNFMTVANAYADMEIRNGNASKVSYMSAENAAPLYKKMLNMVSAAANPNHEKHNVAFNAIKEEVGGNREFMNSIQEVGSQINQQIISIANNAIEKNKTLTPEKALEIAVNSMAGNPVYDQFGNIGMLSGQMYEDMVLVKSMIEGGDAFQLPQEQVAGTGTSTSRFRVPVEHITGSAKTRQGDINPTSRSQSDNNRTQVNLTSEFKNAKTIEAEFSISRDMINQFLGYQNAVSPALAGFVLQSRYVDANNQFVLKQAEVEFADGLDSTASYTPNVGGSYGLLSPNIMFDHTGNNTANPSLATNADWAANPTKLIQRITNFNYITPTPTNPLPEGDPLLLYKDIIRLFKLPATRNVNFGQKTWKMFVPTSWYGIAMQYAATTGIFNKQLNEMVTTATNGLINNIEIVQSSLMNARTNIYGVAIPNHIAIMPSGSPADKKAIIMPGQTASPYVISENISSELMAFRTLMNFGGPMVVKYNGVYVMQFTKTA